MGTGSGSGSLALMGVLPVGENWTADGSSAEIYSRFDENGRKLRSVITLNFRGLARFGRKRSKLRSVNASLKFCSLGLPARNVQVGHWHLTHIEAVILLILGAIVVEPLVARRRICHWLLRSHLDLI